MTKKLISISFFNYLAYFTESFLLFIILKIYGQTYKGYLGIILPIVYLSVVLFPYLRNYLTARYDIISIFKNTMKCYLLSLLLLFFIAQFKLNIFFFMIISIVMIITYKIVSFEYKCIMHALNDKNSVEQTSFIERYNQIAIEFGYGLCLFFGGVLSVRININYFILFDFIFTCIFAVNAFSILSTVELNVNNTTNKVNVKKMIKETKIIKYILVVLLGYLYFRSDDTVVSFIYSNLENGSQLYGIAIGLATIVSAGSIKLLDVFGKYIFKDNDSELKYTIIISTILMFLSILLITKITNESKYLVIIVALLNGSGTGIFLSNVKAYLISKLQSEKQTILMTCFIIENSMSFIIPLVFINLINLTSIQTYICTITFLFFIWLIYINVLDKSGEK